MSDVVVFRYDMSSQIGLGHFYRCKALSESLENLGFTSIHAVGSESRAYVPVDDVKFLVLKSSKIEEELGEIRGFCKRLPRIYIRDSYSLSSCWDSAVLKGDGASLVSIEDSFACSVVKTLIVNPGIMPTSHEAISNCRRLYGPRFAILRSSFHKNRGRALQAIKDVNRPISKILICMGGSDPACHTESIARALSEEKMTNERSYIIVVGAGVSPARYDNLKKIASTFAGSVELVRDTRNLPDIMLQADFAIGSFGGMAWERMCLGIPSLGVRQADNQVLIERTFNQLGAGLSVSIREVLPALVELIIDRAALKSMREQALKAFHLVDGSGADRIAKEIQRVS